MEIEVLSSSQGHELVRYWKTRLHAGIFVPVAILLAMASFIPSWPVTVTQAAFSVLLAYMLVAQFRLLDDLADLDLDRKKHPERVLSRTTSTATFWLAVVALTILNTFLIAISRPLPALAAFIALTFAVLAWYAVPGRRLWRGIPNYHVILLKYPVFVLILGSVNSASRLPALVGVMISVYLCSCIYELVHDRSYYAKSVRGNL